MVFPDKQQLINISLFVLPFAVTIIVSSYLTYRVLKAGIEIGRASSPEQGRTDGLDAALDDEIEA